MKKLKPSFILIILILATIFLVNDRIWYMLKPTYPFIFDLKTTNIEKSQYLPDANLSILPSDSQTFGIFSAQFNDSMLKSIFQTAGVPYVIKKHLEDLNKCSFIFLDASLDNPLDLSKSDIKFLYHFVANGGILIGNGILNARYGSLKSLFGYMSYESSKKHYSFHLKSSKYFKYFDTKEEQKYTISSIGETPYTNSIKLGTATAIALYDDLTPAITLNKYKNGYAVNLGISLYNLRYRNLLDKDFYANEFNYNHFEPLSDFIILLIKDIYETSLNKSITLHTSKDNNKGTIILTHNIETLQELKDINKIVDFEKNFNITPTCFISPKYYSEEQSNAFFMPKNFKYLLSLQKKDIDFGIYSNPNKKNFFLLDIGTCKESYPSYQQFKLLDTKELPTVCGETKVPKELLSAIDISNIVNFRSGDLLYNEHLPEVLPLFGYKYSSSFFAEDIMSYFPFRYPKNYNSVTEEGDIFEIPVSFKDDSIFPLFLQTSSLIELLQKISNNGGVMSMIIPIKSSKYNLPFSTSNFIDKFYSQIPNNIWKCSMSEFGDFWAARNSVVFRYKITKNKLILTIYSPIDIEGLTFHTNNIKLKEQNNINIKNDTFSLNIKEGLSKWIINLK
jgi:hypothetical protein